MKKVVISLLMLFLVVFLMSGCNGITPSPSDNEYDEENTELAYIKVLPNQVEMSVNQSKKFEAKAYNSDNKLIAMDASIVKWSARYTSCIFCIEWQLSPTQGSTQTTFTPTNPEKTGNYEVWANYGGKWAKADVTVY